MLEYDADDRVAYLSKRFDDAIRAKTGRLTTSGGGW